MKVIINFGNTKVVVPCGNGEIVVNQLINIAIAKYSKIYRLSPYNLNDSIVRLRLKNGAALDPDDLICDVADDREELLAIIDSLVVNSNDQHHTINSNGDENISSSWSSSNLSSSISEHEKMITTTIKNNSNEVIVTDADLQTPALRVKNELCDQSDSIVTESDTIPQPDMLKYPNNGHLRSSVSNTYNSQEKFYDNSLIHTVYSPPTTDLKLSAAPLQSFLTSTLPSSSCALNNSGDSGRIHSIQTDEKTGDKSFCILLPKDNSPLGIHVIPYHSNNSAQEPIGGLVLQNIEPDGRIKKHGFLSLNDRIIEINQRNIEKCTFDEAQFIFHDALSKSELELKIIRSTKKSYPIPPKSITNSIRLKDEGKRKSKLLLTETKPNQSNNNDSTTLISCTDNDNNINALNTRKLGRIIKIKLVKGNDGLGFKLASRDNPTGAANPIYVKSIFPKGAAIDDGRLQRGDRLLKVNLIDVTNVSLQDTVGLLRETRIGETVELIISRQRDGSLPHDLIVDHQNLQQSPISSSKSQIFTYDIPLNDTSSAGLGITLKGKTSIIDGQSIDLGIYVKTILMGGAASRDGRLLPNDQLLIINESSLINTPNLEAAEILHDAVRHEIIPGHIKVTISRSQHELVENREDENTKNKDSYQIINTSKSSNENNKGCIRETDLPSLTSSAVNQPSLSTDIKLNENELDLTAFVPSLLHSFRYIKQSQQQQYTAQSNRSESNKVTEIDNRSSSPRSSFSTVTNRSSRSPSKNTPNFNQQQYHHHVVSDYPQQHREPKLPSSVSSNDFKIPSIPNNNDRMHDNSENGTQNNNPFERETAFRQSISEKRRLSHQPNQQALHWKQRSFHETHQGDRKQATRVLPITPPSTNNGVGGLARANSLESIHTLVKNEQQIRKNNLTTSDDEYKRQAHLRSRACNESFRQAVDKSYGNPLEDESPTESIDHDKSNKDKQRFRFTNLFLRTKRKDKTEKTNSNVDLLHEPRSAEEERSNPLPCQQNLLPKHPMAFPVTSSNDENQITPSFLPPPAPFSTRQDSTSTLSSKTKISDTTLHDRSMNLSYPISSFEIKPLTTFENLHQLQQLSTSNNIISDRNKTVSSGYEPYRFDNQCQIISQQHVNLVDHFSPPACSNEKSNNTVITTALDFNPKSNALLPQRDTLNQCSKSAVQPPLKKISSSYHNIDNQDNIPYRPSPQFASLTLSSVGQKHQQHLPLPIQFQNGTQSLRHPVSTHAHHRSIQSIYYNNNRNQHNVKSAYPSTFTVQPIHYTSYSHNIDQQQQQTPKCTFIMLPPHYLRSTALHENPANV